MPLAPHQQRVVEERAELDAKVSKLGDFFATDVFKALPRAEQSRLALQHHYMLRYSEVLGERIQAFGG